MKSGAQISFSPFRFDPGNECLWRGTRSIALKPKDFAVLQCLVDQPGQLVTKQELLDTVWSGTTVSEGVLKVCIRRIRRALGDTAKRPRFIETVHRRGYRFVAPLSAAGESPPPHPHSSMPTLVGREQELALLHGWFGRAQAGTRQLVFVTGEAGIGKTTLVEAFLRQVEHHAAVWVGRGQCIEQHGAGEAYMPVLEALERLCRRADGKRLPAVLAHHAPSWLAQLPSLLEPGELEALQRRIQGVTRERMLREMVKALEALTGQVSLVLVLEDLQWSDHSTLALLSVLALRQEAARLLVVATYRPADISNADHPLAALGQELRIRRHCRDLPLAFLPASAVGEYLAGRFPLTAPDHARLTGLLHRQTDGNPLFLVNLLDYLVARGYLAEKAEDSSSTVPGGRWEVEARLFDLAGMDDGREWVPDSLRQMIEKQIDCLNPHHQQLLETASVAGVEFSAAALGGSNGTAVQAEAHCQTLARGGKFLYADGWTEWPDGTVAGRYRFIHSLYQNVLYGRIPAGRRLQLHRAIGEREEQAYGGRAGEIAAELAMHFEQARVFERAVPYRQQAAHNALHRRAYQEAITHLSRGLSLLDRQHTPDAPPDRQDRRQQEIALLLSLSVPLAMTKGYAAPEVEEVYSRARSLCEATGETRQLFLALRGLGAAALIRAELYTARQLGEQFLALAERQNEPTLLLSAHNALGIAHFHRGEFSRARAHLEKGLALDDPHKRWADGFVQDPGVVCRSYTAFSLCVLGFSRQARSSVRQAVSLARRLAHPHSLAYALGCAAIVSHMCRDERDTRAFAEETLAVSQEHGFAYWLAMGTILVADSQPQAAGRIEQIRQGLDDWEATGAAVMRPYYLAVLAEAYATTGRLAEGLQTVDAAVELVGTTHERFCEAELYRIRAGILLAQDSHRPQGTGQTSLTHSQVEEYFRRAIALARRQQARLWELRAVLGLSRMWQTQGRWTEARELLEESLSRDEAGESVDMGQARALLAELS